jgi:hypothetical protein
VLKLVIPERRFLNEKTNEFITVPERTLRLEHSLVSLSKWEEKWHKPFLSCDKDEAMSRDYIRCMCLDDEVPGYIFETMSDETIEQIVKYIDDPHTATTLPKNTGGSSGPAVTAEIIYWWMIALNVPAQYETWHLGRLLTLINVCSIKSKPGKKMSRSDIYSRNKALNAARRAKYGVPG